MVFFVGTKSIILVESGMWSLFVWNNNANLLMSPAPVTVQLDFSAFFFAKAILFELDVKSAKIENITLRSLSKGSATLLLTVSNYIPPPKKPNFCSNSSYFVPF